MTINNPNDPVRASFIRRLAAMIYDCLVAVAVGMLSAIIMTIVLVVLLSNGVLPMEAELQPSEAIQASFLYTTIIQVWSALWVITFFLWFWKNGGQTIGMRSWRLRLFAMDQQPVSLGRLMIRLVTSLLGLGTLFVLFDIKHKLALQDRASRIEMLLLSKHDNDHKNW